MSANISISLNLPLWNGYIFKYMPTRYFLSCYFTFLEALETENFWHSFFFTSLLIDKWICRLIEWSECVNIIRTSNAAICPEIVHEIYLYLTILNILRTFELSSFSMHSISKKEVTFEQLFPKCSYFMEQTPKRICPWTLLTSSSIGPTIIWLHIIHNLYFIALSPQ